MSTETYTLRVTRVVNGWIVEPMVSHHSRASTQDIMIVPDGEDLGAYINAQITSQKLMTDEKREALLVNNATTRGAYTNSLYNPSVTGTAIGTMGATAITSGMLSNATIAGHNLFVTDDKVYAQNALKQYEENELRRQGLLTTIFGGSSKP